MADANATSTTRQAFIGNVPKLHDVGSMLRAIQTLLNATEEELDTVGMPEAYTDAWGVLRRAEVCLMETIEAVEEADAWDMREAAFQEGTQAAASVMRQLSQARIALDLSFDEELVQLDRVIAQAVEAMDPVSDFHRGQLSALMHYAYSAGVDGSVPDLGTWKQVGASEAES